MPNVRVAAAAGGLPSRRCALAALAGAAAALSLPKAAAALEATSPDAALIAQGAKVEALAWRRDALWGQLADLEERVDDMKPPAPSRAARRDIKMEKKIGDDGSFSIFVPHWTLDADELAEEQQHDAAKAAWETECKAIEARLGVPQLAARCERLDDRVRAEVATLTGMTPATIAGVAAKVRAGFACNPDRRFHDSGLDALHLAALRDVLAIGGAA